MSLQMTTAKSWISDKKNATAYNYSRHFSKLSHCHFLQRDNDLNQYIFRYFILIALIFFVSFVKLFKFVKERVIIKISS